MLCIIHFGPIGYQPTESHTTRDSDTSSWPRLGYFIDSEQLQNWAEHTSFGKTLDRNPLLVVFTVNFTLALLRDLRLVRTLQGIDSHVLFFILGAGAAIIIGVSQKGLEGQKTHMNALILPVITTPIGTLFVCARSRSAILRAFKCEGFRVPFMI